MNWVVTAYIAILFFVLTPGVLLSLPPKSSKLVVAATHAVVFAVIYNIFHCCCARKKRRNLFETNHISRSRNK